MLINGAKRLATCEKRRLRPRQDLGGSRGPRVDQLLALTNAQTENIRRPPPLLCHPGANDTGQPRLAVGGRNHGP
jgi:hypothetical protein